MRQFFITVIGVVFGIFAFFIVSFILSLDMRVPLPDHGTGDTLFGSSTGVVDVVRNLEAAQSDDRIKGLFIRADSFGLAPAFTPKLNFMAV